MRALANGAQGPPRPQEAKWKTEGECRSEMPGGAGESGALHPAHLVFHRGNKAFIDDDVIDDVIAENDGVAFFRYKVSEYKIVGAVIAKNAEAADLFDTFLADHHGWSQRETHSFGNIRGEYPRCHLDGHTCRLKSRPDSVVRRNPSIKASEHAHSRVGERFNNAPKVMRLHAHIAVADYQQRVTGN